MSCLEWTHCPLSARKKCGLLFGPVECSTKNILTSSLQASKTKSLWSWEWVVFGKSARSSVVESIFSAVGLWLKPRCQPPAHRGFKLPRWSLQLTPSLPRSLTHSLKANTLFRGGIIHYYFDARGLQDYPLCTIDFQHFFFRGLVRKSTI